MYKKIVNIKSMNLIIIIFHIALLSVLIYLYLVAFWNKADLSSIDLNANLLVEASKYTNADGEKELAADIQLATDAKDTKVDIEDIPNFTIDQATYLLPELKGTGLVYDSFIRYNIDPEFKALAQEMSTNMSRVASEFDSFIEQYSGYTAFVNEMKERYSIDEFEMQESDKKAWIVEHFEATDKYTTNIENYYHSNLTNSKIPTHSFISNATIDINYHLEILNSLDYKKEVA